MKKSIVHIRQKLSFCVSHEGHEFDRMTDITSTNNH